MRDREEAREAVEWGGDGKETQQVNPISNLRVKSNILFK